jgi:hypothetical protein
MNIPTKQSHTADKGWSSIFGVNNRYEMLHRYENLKRRNHLEDLVVDGKILKLILGGNRVRRCGLEHGNESSGSINGGEFLD